MMSYNLSEFREKQLERVERIRGSLVCVLGKGHPCVLNIDEGYCQAITNCPYQVREM